MQLNISDKLIGKLAKRAMTARDYKKKSDYISFLIKKDALELGLLTAEEAVSFHE